MKQGLLALFTTGMVCMTQDFALVPFLPQALRTSHWHSSW